MAKRKPHQMATRMIGRFIVADPAICHGKPTFRGTRILVADVLEQVAGGMAWQTIVDEWRGDISPDAISEAVRLASQAFRDHFWPVRRTGVRSRTSSCLIILDENIIEGQRRLLEAWRLAARQIGVDVGAKGLKDAEIIVLLRRQRSSTFFTRDAGFYLPEFRNLRYCLVV